MNIHEKTKATIMKSKRKLQPYGEPAKSLANPTAAHSLGMWYAPEFEDKCSEWAVFWHLPQRSRRLPQRKQATYNSSQELQNP